MWEWYEQLRKNGALRAGSYVFATLLVCFIIVASSETLSNMLGFSWLRALHNEEAGVYTDCSLRENRGKAYCQPKTTAADRTWRDLGRAKGKMSPFTLHDGK